MVDIVKEEIKRLRKARFYKNLLDKLAYISLGADISIAIATLISINIYSSNTASILHLLNYALTFIVIITIFVFILFAFVSNYHRKIVGLISNTGKIAGKTIKKRSLFRF